MRDGLSIWSLHASCTGKPSIHLHAWAVQDVCTLAWTELQEVDATHSERILVEYVDANQEEDQVPPNHSFVCPENQSFPTSLHQITRHRHYFTPVIISMLGR